MIQTVSVVWDNVPDKTEFPYTLPAVKTINEIRFDNPVTILVGENGSGKSTLLEGIAVSLGCNPEGGSRNFRFSTADSHSALHNAIRVARNYKKITDIYFYRAETYYNVAAEMRRLDAEPSFDPEIKTYYGGKVLHELSHGESVIQLLRHRFKGGGVYIMDEPEAALSPVRQLEMIIMVRKLVASGAQFILATHSPILMAIPGASIYELSDQGVARVEYSDIQHVALYKRVISDPSSFIDSLWQEQ